MEPKHYTLNFENERVEVVSVHYGPHEKSVLHDHPGGVVVSLTEAHLRFTDENGKVREVYSKPGEARWYPPFKHKVENLGDTSYEAVYIGVKGKLAAASNGTADPDDCDGRRNEEDRGSSHSLQQTVSAFESLEPAPLGTAPKAEGGLL